MKKLRVAELFAGIGGVVGGFLETGRYQAVFLQDADAGARDVFVHNYPYLATAYRLGDVRRLTGPDLAEACGELDGLLACPPCQGFSAAGKRDEDDSRNDLLLEFSRLIRSTLPRFFLLENVPSLLSSQLYADFSGRLKHGYALAPGVVNAAEYGVPQLRRRAVVLGMRRDLGIEPTLPAPTHGGTRGVYNYASGTYLKPHVRESRHQLQLNLTGKPGRFPLVRLEDALGDLPLPGLDEYASQPNTAFQRLMRVGAPRPTNHVAWKHGDDIVERLAATKPGEAPRGQGSRRRNDTYFSQAYARLHRHGLARTLTTNFHNPGSGRFTHYASPRTLTLREALRIQTFPDTYEFDLASIHRTDAERMIGNAFPRRLARAVAFHVARLLD